MKTLRYIVSAALTFLIWMWPVLSLAWQPLETAPPKVRDAARSVGIAVTFGTSDYPIKNAVIDSNNRVYFDSEKLKEGKPIDFKTPMDFGNPQPYFKCLGCLIGPQTYLTAAHCINYPLSGSSEPEAISELILFGSKDSKTMMTTENTRFPSHNVNGSYVVAQSFDPLYEISQKPWDVPGKTEAEVFDLFEQGRYDEWLKIPSERKYTSGLYKWETRNEYREGVNRQVLNGRNNFNAALLLKFGDWAVIKLDRPITDRAPLKFSKKYFGTGSWTSESENLYMVSTRSNVHPLARDPGLKYFSLSGRWVSRLNDTVFQYAGSFTKEGNSGSCILDENGAIVGVHRGGIANLKNGSSQSVVAKGASDAEGIVRALERYGVSYELDE